MLDSGEQNPDHICLETGPARENTWLAHVPSTVTEKSVHLAQQIVFTFQVA